MAYYEHVLIARQDISSQAVDQLAEEFAGIITANGGQVTKTENWGLRTLAYRIKKNRKGHYVMMNIDAPPDVAMPAPSASSSSSEGRRANPVTTGTPSPIAAPTWKPRHEKSLGPARSASTTNRPVPRRMSSRW